MSIGNDTLLRSNNLPLDSLMARLLLEMPFLKFKYFKPKPGQFETNTAQTNKNFTSCLKEDPDALKFIDYTVSYTRAQQFKILNSEMELYNLQELFLFNNNGIIGSFSALEK